MIFKKKIEDFSALELVAMLKSEVKRLHYDPCDRLKPSKYSVYQLEVEILRRIGER